MMPESFEELWDSVSVTMYPYHHWQLFKALRIGSHVEEGHWLVFGQLYRILDFSLTRQGTRVRELMSKKEGNRLARIVWWADW